MESRLIARGLASSLWLSGGQTGTLALKPLITGYVGFVLFDCLIHLMWSQFAAILGYLGVQNVPYFFMDSVHGDLVLEGLKLFVCQFIFQSFPKLLTEVPTLIKKSMAASQGSWQRFSIVFLCSLKVRDPQ